MTAGHPLTWEERAALVRWIDANPHAPVRHGRRRLSADVQRDGEVGYLTYTGGGGIVFHPRGSRYERRVDDLASLEIKVAAR